MASLEKMKVTQVVWDGDRNVPPFNEWSDQFSSLVKTTNYGNWIEDYVDAKLNRNSLVRQTQPSYLLEDPDFNTYISEKAAEDAALHDTAIAEGKAPPRGSPAKSTASSESKRSSNSTSMLELAPHFPYSDLPKEARDLDAILYTVLRANVKGSKSQLLRSVTFPSYIQGIIILHKHMEITRQDRTTQAFHDLDQLAFTGDVQKYQVDAAIKIRALKDCSATINHYILMRIMKSFDGKSKVIQHQIAQDLNNKIIDDDLNIFDMVQGYCASLATMGDDTTIKSSALSVEGGDCPYCHGKHDESDCRNKNYDQRMGHTREEGNANRKEYRKQQAALDKKASKEKTEAEPEDKKPAAEKAAPEPSESSAKPAAHNVQEGLRQFIKSHVESKPQASLAVTSETAAATLKCKALSRYIETMKDRETPP